MLQWPVVVMNMVVILNMLMAVVMVMLIKMVMLVVYKVVWVKLNVVVVMVNVRILV